MKRLTLAISLAVLSLAGLATTASAQRNVDAARLAIEQNRDYRGDVEFRGDRDWQRWHARTAADLDRLNAEVRELRFELRRIRAGGRFWARYQSIVRDTDRLTALFRQGRLRGQEVRSRAAEIRSDVYRLRRWALGGGGGWR
jgi:hypothetical protein